MSTGLEGRFWERSAVVEEFKEALEKIKRDYEAHGYFSGSLFSGNRPALSEVKRTETHVIGLEEGMNLTQKFHPEDTEKGFAPSYEPIFGMAGKEGAIPAFRPPEKQQMGLLSTERDQKGPGSEIPKLMTADELWRKAAEQDMDAILQSQKKTNEMLLNVAKANSKSTSAGSDWSGYDRYEEELKRKTSPSLSWWTGTSVQDPVLAGRWHDRYLEFARGPEFGRRLVGRSISDAAYDPVASYR